jgi:hypothetical protein
MELEGADQDQQTDANTLAGPELSESSDQPALGEASDS